MLKRLTLAFLIATAPAVGRAATAPDSIVDDSAESIVDSCYAQFWRLYPRVEIADLVARGLLNHGRRTTAQQAFITSCTIGRGRMKGARK